MLHAVLLPLLWINRMWYLCALAFCISIFFYIQEGVYLTKNSFKYSMNWQDKYSTENELHIMKVEQAKLNLSLSLLKAETYVVKHEQVRQAVKRSRICERYRNESGTPKITIKSIWTEPRTPPDDITLVVIMTVDRFRALDQVMYNWPGPISICLYADHTHSSKIIRAVWKRPRLLQRKYMELSIVVGAFEFIPINWMRQVALDQARTNHVLLFDVDFIPSPSIYENLQNLQQEYTNVKKVLVIPVFEVVQKTKWFYFPETKTELISSWNQKLVQPFLSEEYYPSQAPTNFTQWKKAQHIYHVPYQFSFEPYVFGDKRVLPSYDIRFHGRYYNKVSFFCQMELMNFELYVTPTDFAIHYPHSRDLIKMVYPAHEKCSKELISQCRHLVNYNHTKVVKNLKDQRKGKLRRSEKN